MADLLPWEEAAKAQITTIDPNAKPWEMDENTLAQSFSSENNEKDYGEMPALDIAATSASNFLPSLGGVAVDIYEAITNPIDTAHGLVKIAAGALQASVPDDFVQLVGEDAASKDMWDAVSKFYADRYGSMAGFKEAVATDPASVMMDAATVLTAGSSIGTKAGLPAQVTSKINTAARLIDPISGSYSAIKLAKKVVGQTTMNILGLTTGAGVTPVKAAYQAGKEGGTKSKQFVEQMRGVADPLEMLKIAKENLANFRIKRSNEYKVEAAKLGQDVTALSFKGINETIKKTFDNFTFKGVWKNKDQQKAFNNAVMEIEQWERRGAEYHTALGLDALKQRVYALAKEADGSINPAVTSIYHGIKKTIAEQAPLYNDMMLDYSRTSEKIIDIEKTLSLTDKASKDTTMRKLQSLMRDNVQTNYGQRTKLGTELEASGKPFMTGLAGQAMSEYAPRGLARVPAGIAVAGTGLNPAAAAASVPYFLSTSPRIVGEATHAAGQMSKATQGLLGMLPDANYNMMLNAAYQAQQPKE